MINYYAKTYPETQLFTCEDVKVYIHIGGLPSKYTFTAKEIKKREASNLFISEHSHILKVMYDQKYQLLHINTGATGKSSFHQLITLVCFVIEGKDIKDFEIIELEK